ncbi:MAG: YaiO family outer membrane beta-barrel protein [Lutibacter sp.]|nr:YaiO family outer membrane beta-barrel protein [Lutibacter sp.]MDP3944613.1 YaiO family outer membrane beta-barrel protein [Lutibacter sp.]
MNSKKDFKWILILAFLSIFQSFGQQKVFEGDPDTAFKKARELAFNNQRKQAQDTLLFILTKYPDYHDIRSFLASTYSWDGEYKKAKTEFSYVLGKDPKRKTDWIAAINNELWADTPFSALELADNALKYFPSDGEILYLKATAQENSNNPEEALRTIQLVLDQNPNNQKALDYKKKLNTTLSYNAIGIKSSVDFYSETFDPMQYYTLNYGRQTKYGSVLAKMNFRRSFNKNGVQVEVDMYPKITKGLYAYVNVGFANTFLFPDVRYGAELYKSLPKSFEVSLGFRALKYESTTTIYTGSVGWYTGNSYWNFRPYLTPGDSGTSKSGVINYRKYRSDADNYFSVSLGMGFSPEFERYTLEGNEDAIINLQSQKLNVGYYFTSSNKQNAWGALVGVAHQEISFKPGSYFWIYSVGLNWELKFR